MMKNRRTGEISRNGGQALVEFSLVLFFILVPLVLGIYDFSRAIQANNIIANMSREGANLAARGGLTGTQSQIDQNIMNALAYTAQPLNMQANGMMYITVIQGAANGYTIQTPVDAWSGSNLAVKPPSRVGPTNLAPFTLAVGQTAYVVEVFYNYPSLFSTNRVKITPTLYSRTIF